jgi:hypothetical protein
MRFTEWIICPDAYLYVLGTAITYELFASNRKARMTMLLRELKSSPEQMKSLDTNKDGILSMPEWDKGVNALQQKVMQEEIANGGVAEQGISFVVQKGPSGSKFTFLDKSKNEFANSLLLQAQGEVLLGSIMLVAAIVLLCV